jgi:hypothetical protein
LERLVTAYMTMFIAYLRRGLWLDLRDRLGPAIVPGIMFFLAVYFGYQTFHAIHEHSEKWHRFALLSSVFSALTVLIIIVVT